MNIEIANKLLTLRKQYNLSQEELAEKLGISRQAVSKWERAEASPDTDNLITLAKLYNISLDELLLSKESEEAQKDADTKDESGEPESKTEKDSSEDSCAEKEPKTDRVNISGKGIHVCSAKGEEVHIGLDGVFIKDKDSEEVINIKRGHVFRNGEEFKKHCGYTGKHIFTKNKKDSAYYRFPYFMITLIAFFLLVYLIEGGWKVSWLVFLTIPLYYTAVSAIINRNASNFSYPVLAVLAFFVWGFF